MKTRLALCALFSITATYLSCAFVAWDFYYLFDFRYGVPNRAFFLGVSITVFIMAGLVSMPSHHEE